MVRRLERGRRRRHSVFHSDFILIIYLFHAEAGEEDVFVARLHQRPEVSQAVTGGEGGGEGGTKGGLV